MRNIIKRVTIKSKAVATFLAISGFAISSLAIAMPVNAQPDIVAALIKILRLLKLKCAAKILILAAIKSFLPSTPVQL